MKSRPLRRNLAVVAVLGLLVFVALPFTSASAAGYHVYSGALESSSGSFTGVSSHRLDSPVGGQAASGCSAPYTGVPMYQTEWVLLTSDALNWRELGTGHQCNDTYRYWYWGYGVNGNWYSLGYQTGVANGVAHTFKIVRSFNGTANVFYYQVDGVNKGSLTSSATGAYVEVGLESYSVPPSYLNATSVSSLQVQRSGGSFVNFSGRDGTHVTDSRVCGKWLSDTNWQYAQATPCP